MDTNTSEEEGDPNLSEDIPIITILFESIGEKGERSRPKTTCSPAEKVDIENQELKGRRSILCGSAYLLVWEMSAIVSHIFMNVEVDVTRRKFLFEKKLQRSDVGSVGRIILPKA
ncbi:hypothetical protein ACHQM5_011410 [Ranunculus cassubicifolius]